MFTWRHTTLLLFTFLLTFLQVLRMTLSKKHFHLKRTSTRAVSKQNDVQVDIAKANLVPQYTSVENLYQTHPKSLPLGAKYTRGLPNSACIDRFESAKKLAEVRRVVWMAARTDPMFYRSSFTWTTHRRIMLVVLVCSRPTR